MPVKSHCVSQATSPRRVGGLSLQIDAALQRTADRRRSLTLWHGRSSRSRTPAVIINKCHRAASGETRYGLHNLYSSMCPSLSKLEDYRLSLNSQASVQAGTVVSSSTLTSSRAPRASRFRARLESSYMDVALSGFGFIRRGCWYEVDY